MLHHRRTIRLPDRDYSAPGGYFVTLVIANREPLLGDVRDGQIQLTPTGEAVSAAWQWLPEQYPYVSLGEWIVMPNHLHGIIWIMSVDGPCRGGSRAAPTLSTASLRNSTIKPLGQLIGAFKTVSTKQVNRLRKLEVAPLWQRNYYEHIIRDGEDLDRITAYIRTNPLHWHEDPENIL